MLLLNSCLALYLYLTTCAAVRNAPTGFSHQLLRNATGAPTNSSKLYLPSANEVRIQIPNASPGTVLILYNIKRTYLHGPAMTAILFTHLHYILHVILEFNHGNRRVPLDEYNIEQGGILGLLKVDIHGLEGGPLWYGQVADVLAGLEAYAQRTNLWAAMWILVVDGLPTANGVVRNCQEIGAFPSVDDLGTRTRDEVHFGPPQKQITLVYHMLSLLRQSLAILIPLSLSSTIYLYCYPYILRCAFVPRVASKDTSFRFTLQHLADSPTSYGGIEAPFRLLALGDPQLEGVSSLLNPEHGYLPSLNSLQSDVLEASTTREGLDVLGKHILDLTIVDIPRLLYYFRKRLDLVGNDYYLAHIYRTLHRTLKPTHVTVLGDLLGSQWISDKEFEGRAWRFWKRVFKHGARVDDDITGGIHLGQLGQDDSWETRIINVAGNHDIGYAGDITPERMERFERAFGRANWETRFTLPSENTTDISDEHLEELPELRIIVLNDLNLDTPALDPNIQATTYQFINDAIGVSRPVEDKSSATILLTHVPMHKREGVCVDGPYFTFHDEEYGGGLKEQNHLSYNAAKGIMEGIYGMSGNPHAPGQGFGRNGIILTGHDHEGCDVYHHLPDNEDIEARKWKAEQWWNSTAKEEKSIPGIREVTVRSMMGDFGGNAGLLSAWFEPEAGVWRFEYSTCALGTQHIWWGVHILDIITVIATVVVVLHSIRIRRVPEPPKEQFKLRKRANTLDAWLQTANVDKARRPARAVTFSSMDNPGPVFGARRRKPI